MPVAAIACICELAVVEVVCDVDDKYDDNQPRWKTTTAAAVG